MKSLTVLVFVVVLSAFYLTFDMQAQQKRSTPPSKYSKFTHKSHTGKVKSLVDKTKSAELDCAYCHGTATKDKLGKDQHDLEIPAAYPSHKNALANEKVHSACTECHILTGGGTQLAMCTICHQNQTIDQKKMATNIRKFPNPDGGGQSQFYDFYSHSDHTGYFSEYAQKTSLKSRLKFFDKTKDAKANKGLDKDFFECAACHTTSTAPVTASKIKFAAGVKMSTPNQVGVPSHPECFICHFDPKIVSPPKKDKPDPKNTYATNCIGCHLEMGKPVKDRPTKGSELAQLSFSRQIVNNELNPTKPNLKAPLPFSHKTHDDAVGNATADCISCHLTAKTANTISDFYLEDRKTKERQPPAVGCYACHGTLSVTDPTTKKKQTVPLMKQKIEGTVKLETAQCNYCHSLATLKTRSANGIPLPPPSHFGKKAITPTPPPATGTPVATPEPPKPTPAPTPTPTPTPAPKPAEAAKPTPTPTPTPTPPVNAAPATQPTTQTQPPTGGIGPVKPSPTGIVRLGDPKESPYWGQHAKWGVVENFNHGTHVQPKYSERCEDCHHTNKNARQELVEKCLTCHKDSSHPDTAKKGGGIDVESAYHGVPDSTAKAGNAGCIECHKRYKDKNPNSEVPLKAPCSGCHTEKQARLDPRQSVPQRGWVRENLFAVVRQFKNGQAAGF